MAKTTTPLATPTTTTTQERSELAQALGKGATLTFRGKPYKVEPLDLNDLADLEMQIGDILNLDLGLMAHRRLVLWLALRRIDDRLSAQQKDEGDYLLTLLDVGRMFTLKDFEDAETTAFISGVLRLSGLIAEEGAEAAEGNEPAPEAA